MLHVGIDPSINCSGLTIYKNNKYHFYYHNTNKVAKCRKLTEKDFLYNFDIPTKYEVDNTILTSDDLKNTLRYKFTAEKICDIIELYSKDEDEIVISIESYALHGMGRVFDLAELSSLIKSKLIELPIKKKIISLRPTEVKKFATGKGNSKKEKMLKSFRELDTEETNKILEIFDINNNDYVKNTKSPIEDIVDSYFICKYGMVLN